MRRKFFVEVEVFLLALFLSSVALLGSAAEAVTIKGKTLVDVADIVKEANGDLKIEKHSLLFAERFPRKLGNSYVSHSLYHVFTLNKDGSVAKHFQVPRSYNKGEMARDHTSDTFKAVFPAVASKTYGNNGHFVVSAMGGTQENNFETMPYTRLDPADDGKGSVTIKSEEQRDLRPGSNYSYAGHETHVNFWGCANMTVPGLNEEVIAYAHSGKMAESGTIYFDFVKINEWGTGFNYFYQDSFKQNFSRGIRHVAIAAGDFDNNGYKDELAFVISKNREIHLFIYKLSYSSGKLNVTLTYFNEIAATDDRFSTNVWEQASANAVVGDFDGDGKQELFVLVRTFGSVDNQPRNYHRPYFYKYDTKEKSWNRNSYGYIGWYLSEDNYYQEGPAKAVRADVDGDGKDEIVVLRFPIDGYDVRFDMDYIWFDPGSRTMHRDWQKYHLGGPGNNDLLGMKLSGNYLNSYYYFNECFSITAGPLTGRMGKGKVADDIVISHVDTRKQIWVVKTKADDNGNFTGFEQGKKIFDEPVSESGKYARGAVITADFADEALRLGTPEHQVRNLTRNYVGVFEAFPYHVDNLTKDGTALRQDKPTNFTFSGFKGYESDGEMSFNYVKQEKSSENQSIMFGTSGVKETIFALGNDDVSTGVLTYLKARKTMANAVGEFFPPAKAAGALYGMIQDFITDKVQTVKKDTNQSAFTQTFDSALETHDKDSVLLYEAPQYIWRYPIINVVMPAWWTDGARLSYEKKGNKDVKQKEYITFSLVDDAHKRDGDSYTINEYQPFHEEGNFFSYPNDINKNQVEGYNPNGKLFNDVMTKDLSSTTFIDQVEFSKAETHMEEYQEDIERSGLSDTLSMISDILDIDDISGAPPYTTHNQTFIKNFAKSEKISFRLKRDTRLPFAAATHTLKFIPYVTKEGTMKFSTAVQFNMSGTAMPLLWRPNHSLYQLYADPSLLLPNKFHREGNEFVATEDMQTAMTIRGIRFYVPGLETYVDNNLLKGVKYQIRVPLYNASFKNTGDFKMRLSYSKEFDLNAEKTVISEITTSLKGWDNHSNSNKGWAVFEWTPSENIKSGTYYFFVEIDPDNSLTEVHESRYWVDNETINDLGGNNEGFSKFYLVARGDPTYHAGKTNLTAGMSASSVVKPVYSAGIMTASNTVKTSDEIPEGYVLGRIKFQDSYNIDVLRDYLKSQKSPDVPVPVTCEIEYEGDYIFPRVTIVGYNYKEGTYEKYGDDYSNVTDEDIGKTILHYTATLFPGEYHKFTFMLRPSDVNFDDGANFELKFPIVSKLAQASEEESSTTEEETNPSGEDSNNESSNNNSVSLSSPGGGCELGLGSLMIFGLLGLALKRR